MTGMALSPQRPYHSAMTTDQKIIELGARAKAALNELQEAVIAAVPDAEKEVIADRFNAISDDLAKLGGWDLA